MYRRHPRGGPPSRTTVATVTDHMNQHQALLMRLTNEQRAVDRLIDTIVAHLYGLSDAQAQAIMDSVRP